MKRNIVFVILLFIFAIPISYAQETFPFIGEITKDSVNVRAGANTNFETLCKLKIQDKVKVLEKRFNWYKIELPKELSSCFISQEYLKTDDQNTGIVLANRVNLRARPSLNSTVLSQVNKGQTLNIIAKKDAWYEVGVTDDCFGWINQEFIKYLPGLKELPATIAAIKPLAPSEPIKEEQVIEISGRVEGSGRIFGAPATHKLVTNDNNIYYLKANKKLLNIFLHQKARVKGKISYIGKNKYPLIRVDKIEALD